MGLQQGILLSNDNAINCTKKRQNINGWHFGDCYKNEGRFVSNPWFS